MILAQSTNQFLPPLSPGEAAIVAAVAVAAVLAAAWLLGPPNPVARHWGLWSLRATIVGLVVLVLLNPVKVDELPGPVKHPEIFYLLDASASMQMGNPRSRWDDSLAMIRAGGQLAESSPAVVKPFIFGQRLAAIDQPAQVGVSPRGLTVPNTSNKPSESQPSESQPTETQPSETKSKRPPRPDQGDTRLHAALRQISSRFGRVPPQGIVVFSDGRVHDETGIEQLAAEFAKLKVPIHVVPVGDTAKGGDVAIAAVVAPPSARKLTEVEVQVFVRSFGFDGKRAEVQLLEMVDGRETRQLAPSLPITLQSGYQSVSLSFRTDLATRKLRVAIPTLAEEVSDRNNRLDTEMKIERTKIRVLYVEGSPQPIQQVRVGDRYQFRGPFSDLKQALTEDEDIECVVLVAPGGVGQLMRIAEYAQIDGVRGFPTTVAELAAFDAIILSDVAAETFTEKQLQWIESWIGQRGGGLCMVGGEHSFSSGGWDQTPLASMLPVEMLAGGADWVPGESIRVAPELPPTPHPLWNLVSDDKQNRQIAGGFPAVIGVNRWAGARPNLTTVLATTSVAGAPVATQVGNATPSGPTFSIQGLTSALQGFVPARRVNSRVVDAKSTATEPAAADRSAANMPAIVAGRFGKGRTLALAFPITSPSADELVQKWGLSDNRYYSKFARNMVYWLTETSAIGRRRLVASADKRFYRPGETITVQAATYDESAAPTRNYRVSAMIEPHDAAGADSDDSPLKWPAGHAGKSGAKQYIPWGDNFDLALGGDTGSALAGNKDLPQHSIELPLADALSSGTSSQSLRIELTAWEDQTQVDSTSLEIQILHDPFEQQNPFPNHDLLKRVAAASGGKLLQQPDDLAQVLKDVPHSVGPPVIKRSPRWSGWWLWGLIVGLLTMEWCWRRSMGLA
ncbi:MAG: glutamine amidotransferase [Planctomycetaceae bacterium]|nr:glutamine amidotransferase [Planctomycetaceae bacterium]